MTFSKLAIWNHLLFHVRWHQFQMFLVDHKTFYLVALSNDWEWKWVSLWVWHAEKRFTYPLHFTFDRNVDGLESIGNKPILLDCSKLVFQADISILLLLELVIVFKSRLFVRLVHFLHLLVPFCSGWIVFNFKLFKKFLVIPRFFNQYGCSSLDHIHVLFISTFCNNMLAFIENFFRNHIEEFSFLTCSPVLKPVKFPKELWFFKILSWVGNKMYALFNFLHWYLQDCGTDSLG